MNGRIEIKLEQSPEECVYYRRYNKNLLIEEIRMTITNWQQSQLCEFCHHFCHQGCRKFVK